MARWSLAIASLLLLGASGCFGTPTTAAGADDGSLAWLLPTADEVPTGWALAQQDIEWLNTADENPGTPSDTALNLATMAGGNDATADEAIAAVYGRAFDPRQRVTVIVLRFGADQDAQDWRAWPGFAAEMAAAQAGGDDADDDGGYEMFYSVCGLRPYYGFVRGADVVLVMGSDWGNGHPVDAVHRAALDLTATLQERAQGTGICDDAEIETARKLAGEEVLGRDDGSDLRQDAVPIREGSIEAAFEVPGDIDWYHVDDGGEDRLCIKVHVENDLAFDLAAYDPGGPVTIARLTPESTYLSFATKPGPIDIKIFLQDTEAVAESYMVALIGSGYCD